MPQTDVMQLAYMGGGSSNKERFQDPVKNLSRAYPFDGKFKVTSLFGKREPFQTTNRAWATTFHRGIDLVGTTSDIVVAAEGGNVLYVGSDSSRGNFIWIKTMSGYGNVYMHLNTVYVKAGDIVSVKQKLGVQGSTGNTTGKCLHFGVSSDPDHWNGNREFMDPAIWFGMQNISTIKGKTFDGTGFITGFAEGVNSTNNVVQSATSSSTEQSTSSIAPGLGQLNSLIPSGGFYEIQNLTGITGDWLYGRRYRVLVDIGDNQVFDVSELRCSFSIVKTAFAEVNTNILKIYNLSVEDENKLIQQGQRIIIEAGYQGSQYGVIFIGNIIQPIRSKENGVDYCLTLVSMDSDRYAAYGLISVALVAQQSARDAVNTLITKSSVEIGAGFLTSANIVYPRGKVMFGMSKDYLNQIANSENAMYYLEDGEVNIVQAIELPSDEVFDFGPDSGLIGTPTQTEEGIECEVLINPKLRINSLFHIDNKRIANYQYSSGKAIRSLDKEGIYRVIKMEYTGDTRGQDWKIKICAISQAGILPTMALSGAVYTN